MGRNGKQGSSSSGNGGGSGRQEPLFGSGAPAAAGQPGQPIERALYDALGIAPSASQAEIKAAYRRLALQVHPCVSGLHHTIHTTFTVDTSL